MHLGRFGGSDGDFVAFGLWGVQEGIPVGRRVGGREGVWGELWVSAGLVHLGSAVCNWLDACIPTDLPHSTETFTPHTPLYMHVHVEGCCGCSHGSCPSFGRWGCPWGCHLYPWGLQVLGRERAALGLLRARGPVGYSHGCVSGLFASLSAEGSPAWVLLWS